MIEIQNLVKRYGSIKAVNDISFTVEKGEILGFLGPNGAGKTTTMNIITGYFPPSDGSVKVCGFDVMNKPLEVKKRIGYLPETPPLYPDMKVIEYLSFVCDIKKVSKADKANEIDKAIWRVKLEDVSNRLIKNLSKGYQQRVGIAQALIGNPSVLILDEPTVGLDPIQIIEIRQLIRDLSESHTIILSTHIMQEVTALCDRVVIINKGKIVAIDTPENLLKYGESTNRIRVIIEGNEDKVEETIRSLEGVVDVKCMGEVIIETENESTNQENTSEISMKPDDAETTATEDTSEVGETPESEDRTETAETEKIRETKESVHMKESENIVNKEKHPMFNYWIFTDKNVDIRRKLFFELAKQEMPIYELTMMKSTMEDVFVKLTKENQRGDEL